MSKKTAEQISYNMRRVKNKDSKIERVLRKELWSRGLRYQKNVASIYGHPDIVFKGVQVAVFCDSEFWHGYDWEHRKAEIKSNRDFWIKKIERTIQRDAEVNERLESEGWRVLRFWGRDIIKHPVECANTIERIVKVRRECHWKKRNTKPLTSALESEVSDGDLN